MMFKRTMKNRMKKARDRMQSGNAIVMLFAAIGMAGVVGYGLNTIMRGPGNTAADVSRRTIAENNLVASTRLAISMAAKNPVTHGDCDGDGFVEPIEFRSGTTGTVPLGGGFMPMTVGASMTDPWGTQYGYCVWDPGTIRKSDNNVACGGSTARRLDGSPRDDQPAIAVISAGKNGVFETQCNAYVDTSPADGAPDTAMIVKPIGSDDVVLSYTYAEANGVGAGEWKIDKTLDATGQTASINKNLTVAGGASFGGSLNAAKGLILPKDPGDDSVTGACDETHGNQLRLNMANDPPTIEICNFAGGGGWVTVSGAGSSTAIPGVNYPSCLFAPLTKAGGIAMSGNSYNYANGSTFFTTQNSGGVSCSITSFSTLDNISFTQTQDLVCTAQANADAVPLFSGGYLYLASPDSSLVIYDISNPASMTFKAKLTDATKLAGANSIALLDSTHVVVGAPTSKSITVVDISNPLLPVITGTVSDTTWLDGIRDIAVKDGYAYVASSNAGAVTVVDLTTPATPVIKGHVTGSELTSVYQIDVINNYVVTIDIYNDHLTTVDVSNPTTPTIAGSTDISSLLSGNSGDFKIYGKYLFVNSGSTGRSFAIFDLSDPITPVLVQGFNNSTTMPPSMGSFSVYGHYLYMSSLGDGYTQTVYNLGCNPLTGEVEAAAAEVDPVTTPDRLDSNMIAHWAMNEGTGTTVADSAGSNNGTFASDTADSAPTWSASGPNGASSLHLDATLNQYVSIPSLLGQPHKGTISMWVNAERPDDPNLYQGQFFGVGPTLILGADWRGVYFTYNNTFTLQSQEDIFGTGWHYITVTFDDTAPMYRLYVDGVLKSQLSYAGTLDYSNGTRTVIGKDASSLNLMNNVLDGGIDDVRVYSVPLGPSEVGELYRRMKGASTITHIAGTAVANNYAQMKIAAGAAHTCAIKADNSLWCWGDDTYGQLGNGTAYTADQPNPVKVGTSTWAAVAIGNYTTCAIDMTGAAYCWGRNDHGQAGVTGGANVEIPTKLSGTGNWVQISIGGAHACGVKSDGTGYCWGEGNNGKLGNGSGSDVTTPTAVSGSYTWTQISAGDTNTCGIQTDGSAWCWGEDGYGQLGNGTAVTANQSAPYKISEPGPWANISAGKEITCGVKVNGSGWCWGTENDGSLGNGAAVTTAQAAPYPVNSNMRNFIYIDPFSGHACGIMSDSSMRCWGSDSYGKLGNGTTLFQNQHNPSPVVGNKGWTAVAVGNDYTCGLKADGSAWCWGSDGDLQLGNGTTLTADQVSPTPVTAFLMPPIWDWNDNGTVITANSGYSLALGSSYLLETSAATRGFYFSSPGKASIVQNVDSNQFLLDSAGPTTSSQLSLRTASNTTATDYTTNLVAKWTLDDATGSTTTTSSPGSIVGTLNNGPVWMPSMGRNGGSLYFDGIDDNVSITNSSILRPGSATGITVAAWVKLDGTQAASARIVSKAWTNHTSPTYESYALSMDSTGTAINFVTGKSGGTDSLTSSIISTNNWVYVVGTFNSSASAPQKKLYINGVLNNSKTLASSAIVYDTAAASGKLFLGQDGAGAERFKGQIDDVRVYSVDLTAAQIAQLYAYQTSLYQVPRSIGVDGQVSNNFQISRNNAAVTNYLSGIATPDLNITPAGLVGIGTASPQAMMDVSGAVRIGADYDCNAAGKIRYVKGQTPPWQYCNGTAWTSFTSVNSGGLKWKRLPLPYESAGGTEEVNCGIKANGTLWCWGYDAYNMGNGASGHAVVSTPVQVDTNVGSPGWSDWVASSTSYIDVNYASYGQGGSGYGIRSNGTLWAWGGNNNGQLGDGTTVAKNRPIQVKDIAGTGYYADWKQIAGGELEACGIRATGQLYCWGDCWNGSCGDNNASAHNATLPVLVKDTAGTGSWSDWVHVSVGHDTVCGIRASGVAYCWGNADVGAIGHNTTTAASTPQIVYDDGSGTAYWSDWKYIEIGNWVGCGLRATGQLYCWGGDGAGATGDGTVGGGDHLRPVLVVNSSGGTGWSDWVSVSLRTGTACGIRSNGTAWCWGTNESAQIGNGSVTWGGSTGRPTQVLGYGVSGACAAAYTDWVSIHTGWGNNCGTRASGDVYCWGVGDWGGIGNSTTDNYVCPQPVTNP